MSQKVKEYQSIMHERNSQSLMSRASVNTPLTRMVGCVTQSRPRQGRVSSHDGIKICTGSCRTEGWRYRGQLNAWFLRKQGGIPSLRNSIISLLFRTPRMRMCRLWSDLRSTGDSLVLRGKYCQRGREEQTPRSDILMIPHISQRSIRSS